MSPLWGLLLWSCCCLLSSAPHLEEPGVPPKTPLSYSQKFLWDSLCLSGSHVISLKVPSYISIMPDLGQGAAGSRCSDWLQS